MIINFKLMATIEIILPLRGSEHVITETEQTERKVVDYFNFNRFLFSRNLSPI